MTDNTFDVWKRPGNRLIVRGNGIGDACSLYEYSWLTSHNELPSDAVKLVPESEGLEPLRSTIRTLHSRIFDEKARADKAERDLNDATEEIEAMEQDLEALRGELATAQAEAGRLTGELTRTERELAEAKRKYEIACNLNTWKEQFESLQVQETVNNASWRKTVDRLKSELAEVKAGMAASSPIPQELHARMRWAAPVLEEADAYGSSTFPHGGWHNGHWSAKALLDYADIWDRERAETEHLVEAVADVLADSQCGSHKGTARELLAAFDMTPKAVGE